MKKIISMILAFSIIFSFPAYLFAAECKNIEIYVNNEKINCDSAPVIINGRTMVPLRVISESMDATVGWNQSTKTVTIQKKDINIEMNIGSSYFTKNGTSIELDAPATIRYNRTLVPVRAIASAFDLNVGWEEYFSTGSVLIYDDDHPPYDLVDDAIYLTTKSSPKEVHFEGYSENPLINELQVSVENPKIANAGISANGNVVYSVTVEGKEAGETNLVVEFNLGDDTVYTRKVPIKVYPACSNFCDVPDMAKVIGSTATSSKTKDGYISEVFNANSVSDKDLENYLTVLDNLGYKSVDNSKKNGITYTTYELTANDGALTIAVVVIGKTNSAVVFLGKGLVTSAH